MAAPYADFYLLPIAKKVLPAYRRMAKAASKIFRDAGALEYREFVGDDLTSPWGTLPFARLVKLRKGEVVIGSIVGFKSRAHRDRTNKRIMADPRMAALMAKKPIFEIKRMAWAGFQGIVDA